MSSVNDAGLAPLLLEHVLQELLHTLLPGGKQVPQLGWEGEEQGSKLGGKSLGRTGPWALGSSELKPAESTYFHQAQNLLVIAMERRGAGKLIFITLINLNPMIKCG